MGGLQAAFRQCAQELLWVSAVDMPLLSSQAVELLSKKRCHCEDACVFTHDGRPEPLLGLYRSTCLPVIDGLLEAGENAVKIVSCKLCSEGSYGYKMLGLDPSRSYWRLRRVRRIGHQPYAYEDIYFHPDFFPTVGREFYTKGLSRMAAESGYPDLTVYEDVEALLCLHNTALLLKVETGSPILQIKSYFSSGDQVMMFCRSYHPGDSYKYQSLRRPL